MSGPTNPTEIYFDKGQWGWDGTLWRKLNLTWGYNDRWVENLGTPADAGGGYFKASTAVPAGEVWTLQSIALSNQSGVRGIAFLGLICGGVTCILACNAAPPLNIPVLVTGAFTLKAGDIAFVQQLATVLNDVIVASVTGYKMKVA